jgi:hypothetical protein
VNENIFKNLKFRVYIDDPEYTYEEENKDFGRVGDSRPET